jgi:hypothetical protein
MPYDQTPISENAQLVPVLVSHEAIDRPEEGGEEGIDHLTQAYLEELMRERDK